MVFNEAIIDGKRDYMDLPRKLGPVNWANHRFLTEPDYIEFLDCPEAMQLCPEFPTFTGWTSALEGFIRALITEAHRRGRRPVFCEINSRPLAADIRKAFGGYHVTQFRDPVNQFGSFVRALIDGGTWGFLAHPIVELAIYSPELNTPRFPWDVSSRAAHWISDARYTSFAARQPIEALFHYHYTSWLINNQRAKRVSDAVLDIDNPTQCFPFKIDFSGYRRYDRADLAFMQQAEWATLQRKHRRLWHNSTIRWLAGKTYPYTARAGRKLRELGVPL